MSELKKFLVPFILLFVLILCLILGKSVFKIHKHDYSRWFKVVDNELCTDPDVYQRACTICGKVETKEMLDFSGHRFTVCETVTEPTCSAPGLNTYHCMNAGCTYVRYEAVKALPHTVKTYTTEATCYSEGCVREICEVCNQTVSETVLPATGHKAGEWVVTKAETCSKEGIQAQKCIWCSTVLKERTIAAHGHDLQYVYATNPTCTSEGNSFYTICRECNALFADKKGKEPTTWSQIVIPKLGHDLVDVAEKAATCFTKGNIAYQHCNRCNQNFVNGKTANDVVTTQTHQLTFFEAKAAKCGSDGNVAYYHCELCGHNYDADGKEINPVIKAQAHDWEFSKKVTAPCPEWSHDDMYHCRNCGVYCTDRNGPYYTNIYDLLYKIHSYDKNGYCTKCGTQKPE